MPESYIPPHGESRSYEYLVWNGMNRRCYNPRSSAYEMFGGQGIKVASQWQNSFDAFLADVGPRPSLDHYFVRLDPTGNYIPGNCEWSLTPNSPGVPTLPGPPAKKKSAAKKSAR